MVCFSESTIFTGLILIAIVGSMHKEPAAQVRAGGFSPCGAGGAYGPVGGAQVRFS